MKLPGTLRQRSILLMLPLLLAACGKAAGPTPSATVTDIDGNRYRTVAIGGKTWMAENLRTGRYRNGDPVPEEKDPKGWPALKQGAWCTYENREENGRSYGKLYNWHAVNDPRGLAPEGWHVATDAEWKALAESLGGEGKAGAPLKAEGRWNGTAGGQAAPSGFDAVPSGARRDTDGGFVLLGEFARFWTSTEVDAARAAGRAMEYYDGAVRSGAVKKENGFAVRCVKD